jgi:hypothetical protein
MYSLLQFCPQWSNRQLKQKCGQRSRHFTWSLYNKTFLWSSIWYFGHGRWSQVLKPYTIPETGSISDIGPLLLWDVMPCSLVYRYQSLGRNYRLKSRPWRWRVRDPLKYGCLLKRLRGATSQNALGLTLPPAWETRDLTGRCFCRQVAGRGKGPPGGSNLES